MYSFTNNVLVVFYCVVSEKSAQMYAVSDPAQISPVQQVTEALRPIPLDDPLPAALLTELKQVRRQLIARLIDSTISPVQNVDT